MNIEQLKKRLGAGELAILFNAKQILKKRYKYSLIKQLEEFEEEYKK